MSSVPQTGRESASAAVPASESASQTAPSMDRRRALARLGLGAAAVYVAPTILKLDRSAKAVQPSCTGKSKGNPWCAGQQG